MRAVSPVVRVEVDEVQGWEGDVKTGLLEVRSQLRLGWRDGSKKRPTTHRGVRLCEARTSTLEPLEDVGIEETDRRTLVLGHAKRDVELEGV